MKALDHPGVAKLVETNAEEYGNGTVDLYLITERIAGRDLETVVESTKVPFDDAIRLTIAVLRILEYCHGSLVVHRDIKPCHVILRGDSPDDPVLIDFGIAYSPDTQPADAETQTDEGRGNRFLIGPEHAPGNPAVNRSGVTDICQCLGLLFFAVTKQFPRSLRDVESKKPHERLPGGLRIAGVPDWKVKRLMRIFDTGFNWEPTRRWQSIDTLSMRLKALLSDSESADSDFDAELDSILSRTEADSHVARSAEARRMAEELTEVVKVAVNRVSARLDKYLGASCMAIGGYYEAGLAGSLVISMQVKYPPHTGKNVRFGVRILPSSQIDVFFAPFDPTKPPIVEGPEVYSLGTYDIGFPECEDAVRPLVEKCLKNWAEELLGV
jgi:serine/threonine protein kinase